MPRSTPPVLKIVAEGAGYRASCAECPDLSVLAPTYGLAEAEGNAMVNGWRANPAAFIPQLVTSPSQITAPPADFTDWKEPEGVGSATFEGADVPEHPDDIPADKPRRGRPPNPPKVP